MVYLHVLKVPQPTLSWAPPESLPPLPGVAGGTWWVAGGAWGRWWPGPRPGQLHLRGEAWLGWETGTLR